MKIGMQLPHFRPSTAATRRNWLKDTAQMIDQGGFDSLFVMDHFFQLGGWLGAAEDEMMEGYSTLGFLAAVTEKVRIGLLVGGVIYRHPALVIKTVTTLDVLSGGRMYFGIGAAWYEHETKSLGMRFPSKKERFEQLEDILRLAKQMWSKDSTAFEGKQFSLPYPYLNPQPLSQPHPRIMIGGMGPTKTLLFVAKYGDACNIFGNAEDSLLEERLAILQNHCQQQGRDYNEIEKTTLVTADLSKGVDAAILRGKQLQRLGFEHIIYNIKGLYDEKSLNMFTDEIIPALKE